MGLGWRATGLLLLVVLPPMVAVAAAGCSSCGGKGAGPDAGEPIQTLARYKPNTLFGGELGMDHVCVAVRDLDKAQKTYEEKLGFGAGQPGVLPNGIKNVTYYFADNNYLELLTYYDKEKADWLARYLDKHEGSNFVMLAAWSIDETREFLKGRGMALGASQPGRADPPGSPVGTEPQWHSAFFRRPQPLPGGRIGFIAYRRDIRDLALEQSMKALRAKRSPHPNTARKLLATWMVVKDLEAAKKAYLAAGMIEGRVFKAPWVGAMGQEIVAGHGTFLLLQPADPQGAAAKFLEERGESIMGMSLEVMQIDVAASLLAQKLEKDFPIYDGVYGRSVLLTPDITSGVWLELFKP